MKKKIIFILILSIFTIKSLNSDQIGACVCNKASRLCKSPIDLGKNPYQYNNIAHLNCPDICGGISNWKFEFGDWSAWHEDFDEIDFPNCEEAISAG